jgi:hypothetical protein
MRYVASFSSGMKCNVEWRNSYCPFVQPTLLKQFPEYVTWDSITNWHQLLYMWCESQRVRFIALKGLLMWTGTGTWKIWKTPTVYPSLYVVCSRSAYWQSSSKRCNIALNRKLHYRHIWHIVTEGPKCNSAISQHPHCNIMSNFISSHRFPPRNRIGWRSRACIILCSASELPIPSVARHATYLWKLTATRFDDWSGNDLQ